MRTLALAVVALFLAPTLSSTPAQESGADDERRAALLERVASYAQSQAGPCPWDLRAKAWELDGNPERIFAFVRDHIAFEPYEGRMRGSAGVLLSRGGNAYEKARLLQDMLVTCGRQTRLVAGTLSDDQAASLVRSFGLRDPGTEEPEPSRDAEAILARFQIPPDEWKRWTRAANEERKDHRVELREMVARETAFLRGRLKEAGVSLGAEDRGPRLRSRVAKGHFWVRMQEPSTGRWVDLDPTIADAKPGTAYGQGASEISAADPKLEHRLTLRLAMARTVRGRSQEIELLNVSLDAADVAIEPLQFAIAPVDPKTPAPDQLLRLPPEQVHRHLAAAGRFQAILARGARRWTSLAWDRAGRTYRPVQGKLQEMVRDFGMDLEDQFGEQPKTKLERVWIELRLVGPSETRRHERVLVDDAPLRANDPMTSWNLFLQTHALPSTYGDFLSSQALALLARSLADRLRGRPFETRTAELFRLPLSPALSFALERQEAWMSGGAAALWDRPALFVSKRNMRLRKEGREGWVCSTLDIVQTAPLLLGRTEALPVDGPRNLESGVWDTCLEELATPPCARTGKREATVAFFAHRRMEGRGDASVVRREGLDRAAMPAYTRTWIAACEEPTVVAVVPAEWNEGEKEFYWWSVDAATGRCVGRSWEGEGQNTTDKAFMDYVATSGVQNLFCGLSMLFCVAGYKNGGSVYGLYCCILYNLIMRLWVSNLAMNLFLMIWTMEQMADPRTDPCYWLEKLGQ